MESSKLMTNSHETQVPHRNGDASLGTLFVKLSEDFSTLIRKEIELARTEMAEMVSTVARGTISMIAGGVIAYAGLIVLLLAAAFGLANIIPLWISSLVIGIATIVVGAVLIFAGKKAMEEVSVVPEKTVETLKNDAKMIQEKLS